MYLAWIRALSCRQRWEPLVRYELGLPTMCWGREKPVWAWTQGLGSCVTMYPLVWYVCGMAWEWNCFISVWPVQLIGPAFPSRGINGWGLPSRGGHRGKKLLREAVEKGEVPRGVSSPPRARPQGMSRTQTPAMVQPELCHPPPHSQASLEGDRALSCGTAQKKLLKLHFPCLFFLLEIIAGNMTWRSTPDSLGPWHLLPGRRGAVPADTGGMKPCDDSMHWHECTQSVRQLRGSAYIRAYTECVRGHEKEELAV